MSRCLPVLAVLAILLAGCDGVDVTIDLSNGEGVAGSGTLITETRDLDGFTRVDFGSEGDVEITLGEGHVVRIEIDDNLAELIETDVVGGTLEIRTRNGSDIDPSVTPRYEIEMPSLEAVELSGVGEVRTAAMAGPSLEIALSGVGGMRATDLAVDSLTVVLSGVGDIVTTGRATTQEVDASGVGGYNGSDLQSSTTTADVRGTASAVLWVTDQLDVTVGGTGDVSYYGDPAVRPNVSDLGELTGLGDR